MCRKRQQSKQKYICPGDLLLIRVYGSYRRRLIRVVDSHGSVVTYETANGEATFDMGNPSVEIIRIIPAAEFDYILRR